MTYAPQTVEVSSEAVMSTLAAEEYDVEAAPPPIVSKVASVGSRLDHPAATRSCGP